MGVRYSLCKGPGKRRASWGTVGRSVGGEQGGGELARARAPALMSSCSTSLISRWQAPLPACRAVGPQGGPQLHPHTERPPPTPTTACRLRDLGIHVLSLALFFCLLKQAAGAEWGCVPLPCTLCAEECPHGCPLQQDTGSLRWPRSPLLGVPTWPVSLV